MRGSEWMRIIIEMLTDLKTLTQFLLQRQSFMSLGITLSIDLCEEEGGGNVELFEDGKCPCVRTCYLQADPTPGWSWGSFFYILHSSVSDPDPHVFARSGSAKKGMINHNFVK